MVGYEVLLKGSMMSEHCVRKEVCEAGAAQYGFFLD
jgi:hypothetical protein